MPIVISQLRPIKTITIKKVADLFFNDLLNMADLL